MACTDGEEDIVAIMGKRYGDDSVLSIRCPNYSILFERIDVRFFPEGEVKSKERLLTYMIYALGHTFGIIF